MSYHYWNNFVNNWVYGSNPTGWSDPNSLPLYNNQANKDLSSLYLPEPWWGNDGTKPLHSVVINFNPGEGGLAQTRMSIKSIFKGSYARDIVGNATTVLPDTHKWHNKYRALPILNSLERIGAISQPYSLENHLSVELLPWHTQKVTTNYKKYLAHNIQAVFDHSIRFAADMSTKIINKKLNSVVILRMSGANTNQLLNLLNTIGETSHPVKSALPIFDGKYLEFKINSLRDIKFISIWGPTSRNKFPSPHSLDAILSSI